MPAEKRIFWRPGPTSIGASASLMRCEHLLGGRGVGAHQREHELVAAQAAAQVAGAQLALELARELLERLVADRVAPGVVDLLELVEVHRDDRDRVVLARRAAQLGLEPVVEGALVRQPGERVLERERGQRLLALGQLVGQAGQAAQAEAREQRVGAAARRRRRPASARAGSRRVRRRSPRRCGPGPRRRGRRGRRGRDVDVEQVAAAVRRSAAPRGAVAPVRPAARGDLAVATGGPR